MLRGFCLTLGVLEMADFAGTETGFRTTDGLSSRSQQMFTTARQISHSQKFSARNY